VSEPLAQPVGPEETLDPLCGDWRILQLRGGHRFSTDDLVTAWVGARARPQARRLLDLGAGIGTVGLAALWMLPPTARLEMVEAQELSHRLALRTIALNGLEGRVGARLGDLREPLEGLGRFELITGSPPYIPLGRGLLSPHPQRAACRIELRGDVFDYCRAAAAHLAPEGRFSICHAWGDPRPEQALSASGLRLLQRFPVYFRSGREPTILVYLAGWEGEALPDHPLTVRTEDGAWTPQWQQLRREMGAPGRPTDQ
jgi:tRNA1Val (adenine37-N6)-methyltransferase